MDNNDHDEDPDQEHPFPPPVENPNIQEVGDGVNGPINNPDLVRVNPVPSTIITLPPPGFRTMNQSGFGPILRRLNKVIRAFSTDRYNGPDKTSVECGGKIILAPSFLDQLTRLNIGYPLLFRITNNVSRRVSHCGVLEFTAEDESRCYMPKWMMRNLELSEGDYIQIESIALPTATFSKFQPQSVEFLNITDPKAVLENSLRSFACLTTGDTISIRYNNKLYDFRVLETKPANAVTIIECDMDVDFAPPIGYVEPTTSKETGNEEPGSQNYVDAIQHETSAFPGMGNRLDGGSVDESSLSSNEGKVIRGIPNYEYTVGSLDFVRDLSIFDQLGMRNGTDSTGFIPFGGSGSTLRKPKN